MYGLLYDDLTRIKQSYIHIYKNLLYQNRYIYNNFINTEDKNLWLSSVDKHKEWADNNIVLTEIKNIISSYELEEYINNL